MSADDLTLLSLWIHIPIVTAWIGLVMFDLFVSLAPGFTIEQRGRLVAWSRPFVIVAVLVIMLTGIWQTVHNPIRPDVTTYDELQGLKATTYGNALFWKHGMVLATFALTVLVRFMIAPVLMRGVTASGGALASFQNLRGLSWLSALNLLACLGALIFATRMVWELH